MSSSTFRKFEISKISANPTQEELIQMARVAESAERYEDMCEFMKARVENFAVPLTLEERNLLSVAFKNVIGARRSSWRTLTSEIGVQEGEGASEEIMKTYETYKKQVENELEACSHCVLDLLEKTLIPNSKEPSSGEDTEEAHEKVKVFYLKMAGDYYRYLTESVFTEDYKEKTIKFYKEAWTAAENLPSVDPIRLGLALNYSVCWYEIFKNEEKACALAKTAFDDAIAKLDNVGEDEYKDATLIMQLLRDNLTLWSTSDGAQGDQIQVEDYNDE